MTVHVNPIAQAAPSQRRIISISEASNQLLFSLPEICRGVNLLAH